MSSSPYFKIKENISLWGEFGEFGAGPKNIRWVLFT